MDYQLLPHEYMVMNSDHVSFGKNGLSTDELILTNLHLIYIKKGLWGGKKDQVTIPINQIKIFEGKPQVSVTKTNGVKRLEIYYNGGQAIFAFNNTKDTDKWARNMFWQKHLRIHLTLLKQGLGLRMQSQKRFQPSVAFVEHLCQVK